MQHLQQSQFSQIKMINMVVKVYQTLNMLWHKELENHTKSYMLRIYKKQFEET